MIKPGTLPKKPTAEPNPALIKLVCFTCSVNSAVCCLSKPNSFSVISTPSFLAAIIFFNSFSFSLSAFISLASPSAVALLSFFVFYNKSFSALSIAS